MDEAQSEEIREMKSRGRRELKRAVGPCKYSALTGSGGGRLEDRKERNGDRLQVKAQRGS